MGQLEVIDKRGLAGEEAYVFPTPDRRANIRLGHGLLLDAGPPLSVVSGHAMSAIIAPAVCRRQTFVWTCASRIITGTRTVALAQRERACTHKLRQEQHVAIRVALNHQTIYRYDRLVTLSPQIIRLRPAPHCRTPILSYSLTIRPSEHFINWQQDPQSNYLARVVFPQQTRELSVEVDLVADMTVIDPFDFFLEPSAAEYPFHYEPWLAKELAPYLETEPAGPRLQTFVDNVNRDKTRTVDFLVALNQ